MSSDWWIPLVQLAVGVWTMVVAPILAFQWMKGYNDSKRIKAKNDNDKS